MEACKDFFKDFFVVLKILVFMVVAATQTEVS